MCCQGWERIWSVVHVVWSAVYVCCGAGQLVAGIFFILALPSFILGCNLITGTWNILMGIGVGMVACCSQVTSQRQETLLYMTVAILTANVVNAVISEWGFYAEDVERLMGSHQYNVLVQYASLGTRITGAVVILTAFLDAQLAFCSMQSAAVTRAAKKKQLQLPPHQQHYHHNVQKQQQQYHMRSGGGGGGPGAARNGVQQQHEQVSDIEYIIPRQKPAKSVAQNQVLYNAYSQSWVFDAENNTTTLVNNIKDDVNNPTSKSHRPILVIDGAGEITRKPPKAVKMVTSAHQQQNGNACAARPKVVTASSSDNNHLVTIPDTTHLIANPNPVVHVEDVSDDSTTTTTTSDRKLYYMKSFSRSASPQVLSASSSQLSLNQTQSAPPIYECLDHHQQYLVKGGNKVVLQQQHPSQQQQHINTDDSNQMRRTVMTLDDQHQYQVPQIHKPQQQTNRRSDATSPQTDPVQYACLLKELQSAIVAKKEPQASSQPVQTGNSTNRSSVASATSSSKTSNSDAEFSKELEAALQLIQDLESPNTVESTPSEVAVAPPQIASIRIPVDGGAAAPTMLWRSNSGSDDSEKTISAVTSPSGTTVLPRTTGFTSTGKGNSTSTRILVQCPGDSSQSTSGYSSPTRNKSSTHTPVWSTTSSINGSSTDIGTGNRPLTYTIHNTKSTAVISLYPQTHSSSSNSSFVDSGTLNKSKSVTLVNITNTNNNNSQNVKNNNLLPASDNKPPTSLCIDVLDSSTINRDRVSPTTKDSNKLSRTSSCVSTDDRGGSSISGGSATGTNMWSVKSLLRKKKQLPPRLCPELEGAIVKSESLAYLTEVELVARHDRNTSIQRQIEQKVHQQLSTPRTDYSNC